MRIAIAGDSAGAPLADALVRALSHDDGLEVSDLGEPPEGGSEACANLADRVCRGILEGTYDRAILCCGTGIGVAMSANKVPGMRAAQTHDTYSAERAALSNDAQVITMGARVIGTELALVVARAFLACRFDPKGRSAANVAAVNALDARARPA
jgi:ribose 5-phosphate isomerase B